MGHIIWAILPHSHYIGVNYDAVGQGYMSKRTDDEILATSNSAAGSAKVLVSKVSSANICVQYQAPRCMRVISVDVSCNLSCVIAMDMLYLRVCGV
jgi:hypothetical protein